MVHEYSSNQLLIYLILNIQMLCFTCFYIKNMCILHGKMQSRSIFTLFPLHTPISSPQIRLWFSSLMPWLDFRISFILVDHQNGLCMKTILLSLRLPKVHNDQTKLKCLTKFNIYLVIWFLKVFSILSVLVSPSV